MATVAHAVQCCDLEKRSDVDLRSFYDRASEFSSALACWRGCETRTVERGGLTTSRLIAPGIVALGASVERRFHLAIHTWQCRAWRECSHLARAWRGQKASQAERWSIRDNVSRPRSSPDLRRCPVRGPAYGPGRLSGRGLLGGLPYEQRVQPIVRSWP
jgi:hypothetical protein